MLRDIRISSLSNGNRRLPLDITGLAKTKVTEQFLAGFEFFSTVEDEVGGILCTNHAIRFGTKNKLNGITAIGFAGTVRACDSGKASVERNRHLAFE